MIEGFVYVGDEDPGPLAAVTAGQIVMKTTYEPPWIVVDHTIDRVLPVRWPGRLFLVEVLAPETEDEIAAMARAAAGVRRDAGYTRALGVDVLAELPVSLLFGSHGTAVTELLDAGLTMTGEDAARLARTRHPQAPAAYARAWQRWLSTQDNGASYHDGDHRRTLAVGGAGPRNAPASPIGNGFSLLWTTVRESARRGGGPGAFTDDGDGGERLADPWCAAACGLLDAAMALGAPHLVPPAEAALLTSSWHSWSTVDARTP